MLTNTARNALGLRKRRSDDKGFSLVELIIVIAIMAVLIAILAPQFLKYVERSRVSKDDANLDEIYRSVQIAIADNDIYEALGTGTIRVTFDGTSLSCTDANLLAAVNKSLGTETGGSSVNKLKIVSKKYATTTFTIDITYNDTTNDVAVIKSWT
ncbi:MAG: prepilin-type N-terminal cleavage/methylation domain-containing protein [Oscillospiraceae bacterium]|jgi:type IV pilus assembly protein PilA|nr:prepilin-type N-terminal cleavage/methylation domain-containing protein [Oscillospiraceae bacterium]